MRTCREMGISTVAVYSEADARAPYVRFADEAVHIGPAPSKDSYLNIDRIIDAAKRTGAEAIHPGYGFLSENADFAEACEQAGIVFIGPSPDAIRKMGLKSTARGLMMKAGVSVVPGYHDDDQSLQSLSENAEAIGLAVLIKASAGGGGKGMRVVRNASELEDSIEAARREAEKAFGDGMLLLEKYIERARHIEVQILGDHHGNLVHLFERECSIQRRHQKIIEESPSPALSPEPRKKICETAVAAGKAIGYTNAGTVEFVLAPSGEFYFIEVNTRLQVEHPVTEMITGLDLVKLQIEIAQGKRLPFEQDDIRQAGHAIEARLYAEDPNNNFLPATGTLHEWDVPRSSDAIRIDSGVERGFEVGIHYDPLLAKLIARAGDRESALQKLSRALSELVVLGVRTNREFLIDLLGHHSFVSGNYHTESVDEHLSDLIDQEASTDSVIAAAAVALYLHKRSRAEAVVLPHIPSNYRNNPYRDPSIKLEIDEETFEVSFHATADGSFAMKCGDWQADARLVSSELGNAHGPESRSEHGNVRIAFDGVQKSFRILEAGDQFFVQSGSFSQVVTRLPRYPRAQLASEHESAYAPMPGQVLKVLVSVGQQVSAGHALVILEAMKMEQTLRASTDGVVEAVLVKPGDVVAPGDTLVGIKSLATDEHR